MVRQIGSEGVLSIHVFVPGAIDSHFTSIPQGTLLEVGGGGE
jgi:hypothetical protein